MKKSKYNRFYTLEDPEIEFIDPEVKKSVLLLQSLKRDWILENAKAHPVGVEMRSRANWKRNVKSRVAYRKIRHYWNPKIGKIVRKYLVALGLGLRFFFG